MFPSQLQRAEKRKPTKRSRQESRQSRAVNQVEENSDSEEPPAGVNSY